MVQKYNKPERRPDAVESDERVLREGEPRRVLLAGDTHGDANAVRTLLQKAQSLEADVLFVLGDFGIWDHYDDGAFTKDVSRFSKQAEVPVCFLPGNHDNYDLLFEYEATKPRLADGFILLAPGVLYSPRGHRFTWSGVKFLTLGGAYSVDKFGRVYEDQMNLFRAQGRQERGGVLSKRERYLLRTGQALWWSQEEISEEERDQAMEGGRVDVMLAHDKPRDAQPGWNRKDLEECWPNQDKLQAVVEATLPRLYVHGHLHHPYWDTMVKTGTEVHGLDCDPSASRYSGGTGKILNSWALLELDTQSPEGERGMRLRRTIKDVKVEEHLPFRLDTHEFPEREPEPMKQGLE